MTVQGASRLSVCADPEDVGNVKLAQTTGYRAGGQLNLGQVLFGRIDAQSSWSRRWRRRSFWSEDHNAARGRFTIGRINGRNEVVLDICRIADIQTRLVFSQSS